MCVQACRKPAHLLPDEDWYIANFLKIPREQLLKEKLIEKPVIVGGINGQKIVMKGLRPKIENGWCVFFKDGLCTIHAHKPFGCKYASCETTDDEDKEVHEALARKWYMHNLINNKLEIYDENNKEQQKEILEELDYCYR